MTRVRRHSARSDRGQDQGSGRRAGSVRGNPVGTPCRAGGQWSIRPDDVAFAGERLRRLCDARVTTYVRTSLIDSIGRIGDEASRDWLTAIRDDASQETAIRGAAKSALTLLDRQRR